MRRLALAAAAFLWSTAAHAECPTYYTGEQFVTDLQSLQIALRNLDEATFAAGGKRLEASIVCLSSGAPPPIYASAYRYIGTYHYLVKHDEAGARRWFRTALEIDPTHNWDASELELGHPMRDVYEAERFNAGAGVERLEGKVVNMPAGSTLLIDGRPLTVAEATLDRPHLVQQIAPDKSVRGTWLIEGNQLPPQFLRDANAAATTKADPETKKPGKKGKTEVVATTDSGLQVQKVERLRPPEKTPLMILGALGVAGAGGIYAMSFAARDEFEAAKTTEDLEKSRDLTNILVVTSGGVLVLGGVVGYYGIILDGGAGVGFAGHF
ncbi:MAG: hypothetical protein ACOZNI_32530 [Myxococcota bacterium]